MKTQMEKNKVNSNNKKTKQTNSTINHNKKYQNYARRMESKMHWIKENIYTKKKITLKKIDIKWRLIIKQNQLIIE